MSVQYEGMRLRAEDAIIKDPLTGDNKENEESERATRSCERSNVLSAQDVKI